jgi:poly-beta-1,6-N-acetyl-D-glucosamine biosynthesis protein PgaD
MLPLVTLLLWTSGFRRFSEELLQGGGLDALVSRLPLYAAVIAMLCSALIIWALLNWWRFADRDRRRSCRPVPAAVVARSYGLAPEQLTRWQTMRRLVVLHDSHGRPTGVLEAPEPILTVDAKAIA